MTRRLAELIPERGRVPALPCIGRSQETGIPPLLVLHGLLGSPGNFEPILRILAERDDRTIAAPAYGRRGTEPIAVSQRELLPRAQELVAASPTGTIDVLGHSLGGRHALLLARRVPVRRLVGLGAVFRGIPHTHPRRFLAAVGGPAFTDLMVSEPLDASLPDRTAVTSIVSDADLLVPRSSSALGRVVTVRGVPHESLPRLTVEPLAALDAPI